MERLVLTGATGFLGRYLLEEALRRGFETIALSRRPPGSGAWRTFDLAVPGEGARSIEALRPAWVLHAGALSRIDQCALDPARAHRVNGSAVEELARAAREVGARFLYVSTDQVFSGLKAPYAPLDPRGPVSVYGESKAHGERSALSVGARVVRLALLFGRSADGATGASDGLLAAVRAGRCPLLFSDEFRTPLAVDEAAWALLDLLDAPEGIWHLAGPERLDRYAFGLLAVRAAGFADGAIRAGFRADAPEHAGRPPDLSMECAATWSFLGWSPSPPRDALHRIYAAGPG